MKYESLTLVKYIINAELAQWRDEEFNNGNISKAKRIQKIINRRILRHGGNTYGFM